MKVDSKKKSLNRNSKEKVKLNNSSSDESSIVHRKYSDEESQSSHGMIIIDFRIYRLLMTLGLFATKIMILLVFLEILQSYSTNYF